MAWRRALTSKLEVGCLEKPHFGSCSSRLLRSADDRHFRLVRRRTSGHQLVWSPLMRTVATSAREVRIKNYVSTAGVLAEPYKPAPPPLPFVQRWLTKQGWIIFKDNAYKLLKTAYAIAKLKQKHKGYTHKQFYREATDLYLQINKAFADGNLHLLRRLVTEMFFPIMKKQIKYREGIWDKVHWEMVGPIKLLRTQQARLIGVDADNHDDAFVQITVRIQCYQIFAAYDKNGKIVAGDLEKQLLVEDQWVFEKHLTNPMSVWRLCAQLGPERLPT